MFYTLIPKGQLILKCLLGVFTFFQKMKENKLTSNKVEFVHQFFGRNVGLKKSFRICLTFSYAIREVQLLCKALVCQNQNVRKGKVETSMCSYVADFRHFFYIHKAQSRLDFFCYEVLKFLNFHKLLQHLLNYILNGFQF